MKNIGADLNQILQNLGLSAGQSEILKTGLLILGILILAIISNWITKLLIKRIVAEYIKRSKNEYDDIFLKKGVFNNLSHIVPALLIYFLIPIATDNPKIIKPIQDFSYIYIIIAVLVVINNFLNAVNDIYEIISEKKGYRISIKTYLQVLKIILIVIGVIMIVAIILDKKPGAILTGLGAMTAVLMLIFKDSILGFVAGIQLSAYDMVREGDWITVPSRGVDGDVLDINLNTVKVQNFDKTISTIPTYALVQESFINWKGMQQAGGRRIKRSIYLDMKSIKIVTPQMLEKFRQIPLIKDYIEQKIKELNYDENDTLLTVLDGTSLTNVAIFRVYVENYLRANVRVFKKYKKEKFLYQGKEIERFVIDDVQEFLHGLDKDAEKFLMKIDDITVIRDVNKFLVRYSDHYILENNYLYRIHLVKRMVIRKGTEVEVEVPEKILVKDGLFCDDLTMLVRQLKPTEKGLPIEVYAFAATTDWGKYEKIQADLFEHLLAVLPVFELRVFQELSGNDVTFIKS